MKRIRELRKQRGLSQMALSGMLGISQSTLSHWEKGVYEPDCAKLWQLADIFCVSVDYIIGRIDNAEDTHTREDASSQEPYLRLGREAALRGLPAQAVEKLIDMMDGL